MKPGGADWSFLRGTSGDSTTLPPPFPARPSARRPTDRSPGVITSRQSPTPRDFSPVGKQPLLCPVTGGCTCLPRNKRRPGRRTPSVTFRRFGRDVVTQYENESAHSFTIEPLGYDALMTAWGDGQIAAAGAMSFTRISIVVQDTRRTWPPWQLRNVRASLNSLMTINSCPVCQFLAALGRARHDLLVLCSIIRSPGAKASAFRKKLPYGKVARAMVSERPADARHAGGAMLRRRADRCRANTREVHARAHRAGYLLVARPRGSLARRSPVLWSHSKVSTENRRAWPVRSSSTYSLAGNCGEPMTCPTPVSLL